MAVVLQFGEAANQVGARLWNSVFTVGREVVGGADGEGASSSSSFLLQSEKRGRRPRCIIWEAHRGDSTVPVGGAVGLEEAASSLPAAPRAGARAAVGSWRAASFTPFSHASLVKVDDASFAMGGEGAFACGRAYFASSGAEIEASSLEALRRMVEECDRLQLLHCISDAHGFWGAFSSELALAARDEFAPPAVHAYPIFPPAASASLVEVARSVAEMQATGDGGGCDRYFPLGLALPPPLGALARSPPGGPLLSPGMLACYMETVLAPLLHADGAARTTVLGLEEGIYGSAFDMHQPCDGAAERAAPSPAPPGGARNISVPGAPWCEAWMAGGCTIVECGARRTERAGAADAPPVLAPIYFSGDDGTMLSISSRAALALGCLQPSMHALVAGTLLSRLARTAGGDPSAGEFRESLERIAARLEPSS